MTDTVTADQWAAATSLGRLGAAMLDAGIPVTDVRNTLNRALAVGSPQTPLSFDVLAAAVFVHQPETGESRILPASGRELSFGQAARLNRLAGRVIRGELPIGEVDAARTLILSDRAGVPLVPGILANVFVGAGLALLFRCPWWCVLVSAVVGGIVWVLITALGRRPDANAIAPFLVAFASTLLVGLSAMWLGFDEVPIYAVIAPIAVLVPGMMITNALIEMTARDIVTGSARLLYGVLVLVLMVVGIAAGAALTHLSFDVTSAATLGGAQDVVDGGLGWTAVPPRWTGWLAVLVLAFAAGVQFDSRRTLTMLYVPVMLVTYAIVIVAAPHVGNATATGIAAALVYLACSLAEVRSRGIPASALFLPAFLLLVPGTVGLTALASMTAGVEPAIAAGATFICLCIGTKVGAFLASLRPAGRATAQVAG